MFRRAYILANAPRVHGALVDRIENQAESLVVALPESEDPRLKIISGNVGAECGLKSAIVRLSMIDRALWSIRGRAIIIGGIAVIEGRDRQEHVGVQRPHPGKSGKAIVFMLAIPQA